MRERPFLPAGSFQELPGRDSDTGCPDVLMGGFPCQDLSIAGRQAGLDGTRSGLWYDFKQAIEALEPKWVIIENVGHTRRRWVPEVRRDLWSLGYSSLPIRVRASDLGATHERSRIFIVANADSELLRKLSRWWLGPSREVAKELAKSWDSAPRRLGAYDGVPRRMDRLKSLGNAVVPLACHLLGLGIKEVTCAESKKDEQ